MLGIHTAPVSGTYSGFVDEKVKQQQLNGNFTQVLDPTTDRLELGNKLTIAYGVVNDSIFVGGLNFTLRFQGDGIEYTLVNSTSAPYKDEYEFDSRKIESLVPGNYSFFYEVNTTQSMINTTASLSIITQSGASLDIIVRDLTEDLVGNDIFAFRGQTKNIQVTLSNFGSSNAYGIKFSFQPINEPVGFQSNNSQSIEINVLASLEEFAVNFSIFPETYGLGKIQIHLEYSDGEALNFIRGDFINIYTVPQGIDVSFNSPRNVRVGSSVDFNIEIFSIEDTDLTIIATLTSDAINFVNENKQVVVSQGTTELTFVGVPSNSSIAQVTLTIVFFDLSDGQDVVALRNPITRTLFIHTDVQLPEFSISQFFMGLLIFINAAILLFFIFVFFRRDIARQLIKRFFNLNYVPDLEFPNNSIVIDGSNVAWEETDKNGKPQLKNILLSIQRLREYRFDTIKVVADAALRYQLANSNELDELVREGEIKMLPAKVDGDSFILRLSAQEGSLILTNDLFKEFREKYSFIDERRVPYTILNGKFFLHPLYAQ